MPTEAPEDEEAEEEGDHGHAHGGDAVEVHLHPEAVVVIHGALAPHAARRFPVLAERVDQVAEHHRANQKG